MSSPARRLDSSYHPLYLRHPSRPKVHLAQSQAARWVSRLKGCQAAVDSTPGRTTTAAHLDVRVGRARKALNDARTKDRGDLLGPRGHGHDRMRGRPRRRRTAGCGRRRDRRRAHRDERLGGSGRQGVERIRWRRRPGGTVPRPARRLRPGSASARRARRGLQRGWADAPQGQHRPGTAGHHLPHQRGAPFAREAPVARQRSTRPRGGRPRSEHGHASPTSLTIRSTAARSSTASGRAGT